MKKMIISIFFIFLTACGNSQPSLNPLLKGSVILAFGDSLTYGTGAASDESYPKILEKITGFRVINAGVPGEETRNSVNRISQELAKYHPQLVIVCLGGNDLIRKRSPNDIKENLKKIIRTIQLSGAQVILIGVPAPGLSLTIPDFYEEVASEMNVPINNSILPFIFNSPENKSDYIHFNALGYKIFAEEIAGFLKKQGAIN